MIIGTVFLLAVWTSSSFAESSESSDKRAPMGFQGMRGKKNIISTSSAHDDELSKRTLTDFQDMHKKDASTLDSENDLLHFEQFEKRAPAMGFQGMRGKKDDYDFASYVRDGYYEKRAPMGFQGMRGKKTLLEDEYYKRAPMGFQGMRGKKSLEEILGEMEKRAVISLPDTWGKKKYIFEYPQAYEKRLLAMGFQGMRGKKNEFPAEWEKRAPMGFQGMRGKKALLDEMQELEKRTIMGLQGTRDKEDGYGNYVDYYMDPVDFDKRAPMGFQGMRGKRNMAQRFATDFETRSPIEYQGVTGNRRNALASCQVKKRSPYRYYEMRGKKNPRWELRGMFVGVRGKKWAAAPYEDRNPLVSVSTGNTGRTVDGDSSAALDSQ